MYAQSQKENTFNVGGAFILESKDAVIIKEKKPNSKYHYDLILENYFPHEFHSFTLVQVFIDDHVHVPINLE